MTIEQLVTRSAYEAIRQNLVVEGYLPDIALLDIDNPTDTTAQTKAKVQQFDNQLAQIVQDKKYAIELFDYGSNQAKGVKQTPRIVIHNNSVLPSVEVGNDPSVTYEKQGDYYISKQSDNLLADLTLMVYAVASTSAQMFVMNNIILRSLPKRGYIKSYELPLPLFSGNFFTILTDKGETEALAEGIMERYFVYQIKDLEELEPNTLPGNIPSINEIKLEIEIS